MQKTLDKIIFIIKKFQEGYDSNRKVVGNERLAFLVVVAAITKSSIPQTIQITKNQFHVGIRDYIFRGYSPRAHKLYRIHLPLYFKKYLDSYCQEYKIYDEDALFSFNSEYVGNRIREVIKLYNLGISTYDIQKCISYTYNSDEYDRCVGQLINVLNPIKEGSSYICNSSTYICTAIDEYMCHFMR